MKNDVKTFRLFARPDEKSHKIANKIRMLNAQQATPLMESENADLVIAIGGDGTFIHAVTQTHFSKKAIYTGIHTGTLGFMQDLCEEDIPKLFKHIRSENQIKTRKEFIALVKVFLEDDSTIQFFALNDVVIGGKDYSKISFAEYIHSELLQNISGCGINISTPTGDTALSASLGGSIDFSNNFQLVCRLIAPITNDVTERFLQNPIICSKIVLVVKPADNIFIKVDGIVKDIDSHLIRKVGVSMVNSSFINKLDIMNYSKVKACRNKLLGYKDEEQV